MVAAGFGVAGPSDMGVSSLMKLDVPVPVMALALVVLPQRNLWMFAYAEAYGKLWNQGKRRVRL